MTMTLEEARKMIAEAEAKARVEAETLKKARDEARAKADEAHKTYVEFCTNNNIPIKGKRKAA